MISTTESTLPNGRETCLTFAPSILCFHHLQKELGEAQLFLLPTLLTGRLRLTG